MSSINIILGNIIIRLDRYIRITKKKNINIKLGILFGDDYV